MEVVKTMARIYSKRQNCKNGQALVKAYSGDSDEQVISSTHLAKRKSCIYAQDGAEDGDNGEGDGGAHKGVAGGVTTASHGVE